MIYPHDFPYKEEMFWLGYLSCSNGTLKVDCSMRLPHCIKWDLRSYGLSSFSDLNTVGNLGVIPSAAEVLHLFSLYI